MSREELHSPFHDPLLQPISSISPNARAASRFSGKFRKTKKELLHDGSPLKSGSLHGRQEMHHEILCAVIHEK